MASVEKRSKQTVSDLKRVSLLEQEPDFGDFFATEDDEVSTPYLHDRPAFMQSRALSGAEIGTAMHTIMQHIDLSKTHTVQDVDRFVTELTTRQLLTVEEANAVDVSAVVQFFATPLFKRLSRSPRMLREVPFTYAFNAKDGDHQILQGIADCLFEEKDGWVLLDYKTDRIRGSFRSDEEIQIEMQKRYGIQLSLYKKAIESIVHITIKEMVLYLFDGERIVHVQEESV